LIEITRSTSVKLIFWNCYLVSYFPNKSLIFPELMHKPSR